MCLIYIFNKFNNEIVVPESELLQTSELLVPLMIVNFQPWKKG